MLTSLIRLRWGGTEGPKKFCLLAAAAATLVNLTHSVCVPVLHQGHLDNASDPFLFVDVFLKIVALNTTECHHLTSRIIVECAINSRIEQKCMKLPAASFTAQNLILNNAKVDITARHKASSHVTQTAASGCFVLISTAKTMKRCKTKTSFHYLGICLSHFSQVDEPVPLRNVKCQQPSRLRSFKHIRNLSAKGLEGAIE